MDSTALYKLSYGIYVLTTLDESVPFGCIVNSVFQITSQPPRIAVSCNRDNFTHGKIMNSNLFGISVLAEDVNPELIRTFGYQSGRDTDKFAGFQTAKGAVLGIPLFSAEAAATFECRLTDQIEVGTHTIFIGELEDCTLTRPDADEMTYRYFHQIRNGKAPVNAPTFIAENSDEEKESWECSLCSYVYNEDTPFEELDDDWVCPVCGASKELFYKK